MVNYRRVHGSGVIYFLTLNLKNRNSSIFTQQADLLVSSFRKVRAYAPFKTLAMVILPDHLHVIWELPQNDDDYSMRWRLIKTNFSKALINSGIKILKNNRNEYLLWQRRFWEHCIRDDSDLINHINYIHYNPVKHQLVKNPCDWTYSSIHRHIKLGLIEKNWAYEEDLAQDFGEQMD